MRTLTKLPHIPEHRPLWIESRSESALELLQELPDRGLAVVGTRTPHPQSIRHVRTILSELRDLRVIILSGLARGIDGEAHATAIDTGIPTIAVLGHGLDHTYPPQHRELRQRILESGGLIVSPFDCAEAPRPSYFAYRNQWIADLARATWLVQAPRDSGANITAQFALRSGRDLYVTPAGPWDEDFAGNCERLESPQVRPLIRARQFSGTWGEWRAIFRRRRLGIVKKPETDADWVRDHLLAWMTQFGGATLSDLLEWSNAMGWLPARLQVALQQGFSEGWLRDERGVFTAV